MQRFLSYFAVFSILTMLFACSGNGGSSNNSSFFGVPHTDSTAPTIITFTIPATAASHTVAISAFTATDSTGVTGYMITTSPTAPLANDSGWLTTAPTSYTFASTGSQTAYAWTKDASGNVSTGKPASVVITIPPAAAVQGVVMDPSSASVLAGVTVNAYVQTSAIATSATPVSPPSDTIIATATTLGDGSFSITGLTAEIPYYFEFVATGHSTLAYYYVVPAATVLVLETVKLIPDAWAPQNATASGTVKNASTNIGLPGMSVKIRPGINNRIGSTITATATSSATGTYSFAGLAAGTYTAEVTGNIGTTPIITSYFTLVCFPGLTAADSNQDFPVTTPLSMTGTGQYKIVLNWGNDPSDLDSHLTGPTATTGTRFHTYYMQHSYPLDSATLTNGYYVAGSLTEAVLDVDNTIHGSNNGPETTTIVKPRIGTYKFYVHHYSGSSTISTSGASVKVYKGNSLLATFNPPASSLGSHAVWSVFTMDVGVSGEAIIPVNTISMIDPVNLASVSNNASFEEYFIFSNLPVK